MDNTYYTQAERIKEGNWNWGPLEILQPQVYETTTIPAAEVRDGDFVEYSVSKSGRLLALWDRQIVVRDGVRGFIEDYNNEFISREAYFTNPKNYFSVRVPRPKPPMNEFGPISP